MKDVWAMISVMALLLCCGTVALSQSPHPSAGKVAIAEDGVPVVIPRAIQYDLTSRITGRTYRIMVATPLKADPAIAYPVIYMLDGRVYFGAAAEMLTRQSRGLVTPAILVGIGYPVDDPEEWDRIRYLDLTPSVSKADDDAGRITGGGDAFLRVIAEEVKPFVMARYKIDPAKQIFYGHSLGGLMVLRSLFRNPTAFSTYIASSPSIWWNNKEVLADEAAFSKRARAGELHMKILITSAGDEQYRGDDPKLLATPAATKRMVDNASELADRLAALNPKNIHVERMIFPGEIHITVSPASFSRALRFALPRN